MHQVTIRKCETLWDYEGISTIYQLVQDFATIHSMEPAVSSEEEWLVDFGG